MFGELPQFGSTMEYIENAFAASVASAHGHAKIANTAGVPQNASDQVIGALAELWGHGRAAGMAGADIQAIADRHVYWDDKGDPWPRPPGSNVVPFRR